MQAKLKVVASNPKPDNHRLIVGQIHRASQRSEDRTKLLTRRYKTSHSAVLGMTKFMLYNGYVGDVCEIYHSVTSLQIGTIKMTIKGKLLTNFIWDE